MTNGNNKNNYLNLSILPTSNCYLQDEMNWEYVGPREGGGGVTTRCDFIFAFWVPSTVDKESFMAKMKNRGKVYPPDIDHLKRIFFPMPSFIAFIHWVVSIDIMWQFTFEWLRYNSQLTINILILGMHKSRYLNMSMVFTQLRQTYWIQKIF